MKQRSNAFFLIFAGIVCVPGLVGCGWGANSSSEVSNVKGKNSKQKVGEVTLCDATPLTTPPQEKWTHRKFTSICQMGFLKWQNTQSENNQASQESPSQESPSQESFSLESPFSRFCKAQIDIWNEKNKQAANSDDESAVSSSGKTNSLSAAFCPYRLTVDGQTVSIDELEKADGCGHKKENPNGCTRDRFSRSSNPAPKPAPK